MNSPFGSNWSLFSLKVCLGIENWSNRFGARTRFQKAQLPWIPFQLFPIRLIAETMIQELKKFIYLQISRATQSLKTPNAIFSSGNLSYKWHNRKPSNYRSCPASGDQHKEMTLEHEPRWTMKQVRCGEVQFFERPFVNGPWLKARRAHLRVFIDFKSIRSVNADVSPFQWQAGVGFLPILKNSQAREWR